MKPTTLITLIISVAIPVMILFYRFYKVPILKYVSRWDWGKKLVKTEYFNTLHKRELNKVKTVERAVKLAKLRNKSSNLKQYVIPVGNDYWFGTMKEWNLYVKEHKKFSGIRPLIDSIYQTR